MKAPLQHPVASHPLSDEEIVVRVQAGEVALYEVLMRRHNQRMYRAVRGILRNESEIDDILQDAYLSAFENLAGFAGRSRFSTWLVRIAINKALDRIRRTSRIVGLDGWPEDEILAKIPETQHFPNPEAESGRRELSRLLEEAIDTLPTSFRSAYLLREVEGLSTRETAECLGIEVATVKTRIHRARARLREALEERVGASAPDTFNFGASRCDALVARVFERIS